MALTNMKKKHSTTSEALQVGKDMGAQYTVLTHFSQRNSVHVPTYDSVDSPNTIVAYDNMQLRHASLDVATKVPPAMKCLLEFDNEN